MKTKNLKKAGFTLIELLVVISIIALLSSVVLVAVQSAREKAQMSKVRSELGEFVKALEIYRTTYGYYPSSSLCQGAAFNYDLEVCVVINFDALDADSFSNQILNDLKNKNIYSGDLIATLKSVPRYSSLVLSFASTPTGIKSLTDDLSFAGNVSCNGKPGLTESSEYYMNFIVYNNSGPIPGLDGTYIGKESGGGLGSGVYCSPNR